MRSYDPETMSGVR